MDDIYKKSLEKDINGDINGAVSINDDLEGFISDIRNNSLKSKYKSIFFLPKITEIILNQFAMFCCSEKNPDVSVEEMALSESKSKYCYCSGIRRTIVFHYGRIEKI